MLNEVRLPFNILPSTFNISRFLRAHDHHTNRNQRTPHPRPCVLGHVVGVRAFSRSDRPRPAAIEVQPLHRREIHPAPFRPVAQDHPTTAPIPHLPSSPPHA